jgi:YVTN family beta-propeller protein
MVDELCNFTVPSRPAFFMDFQPVGLTLAPFEPGPFFPHTPSSRVTSIAIHPKGRIAYVTSFDGVLILDTRKKAIVGTVAGVEFADSIVFTPDGTRAYLSQDGTYGSVSQVHVVDATSHSLIKTIQLPIPTAPLGVAATPDGGRVYVVGWVANNVSVIDSEPSSPTYNTVTSVIPVSGEARGIALSPAGNLAYVTLDTGGVDVIVTAPDSSQFNQVIAHIPDAGTYGGIHGAATSLDGRFLYVSVSDGNNDKLFTVDSEPFSATFNSLITTFEVGKSPLGVAVRPH